MQNQPNKMKRVHHSKLMNSQCPHEIEHGLENIHNFNNTYFYLIPYRYCFNRITNQDENINSDTDTDSQLYCPRAKKVIII